MRKLNIKGKIAIVLLVSLITIGFCEFASWNVQKIENNPRYSEADVWVLK